MSKPSPRHDAQSFDEVLQHSSELSNLRLRAEQSKARLVAIAPLLPKALVAASKAAGLEDGVWHILVPHAASASKLRQLTPQLLAHLNANGLATREIRIKISI